MAAPETRNRAGGFHCLSNAKGTKLDGSLAGMAKIMKNSCSGTAEAEIAALFMNATHAVPLINTLNEFGHKQPATPIWTDNSTAHSILNGKVNENQSKVIDMRFCWLRDCVRQGQFSLKWAPGATNFADCHTEHHSAKHHKKSDPSACQRSTVQQKCKGVLNNLQRMQFTVLAHLHHSNLSGGLADSASQPD